MKLGLMLGYWGAQPPPDAPATLLEAEFAPIDDMRASAAYRRRVLGNLLRRFVIETTETSPTRVEGVSASA